jgi:FAD:protein FMN transferase
MPSLCKVAVARNAMATRFEVVVYGDDEASLRAAAEEALNEIQRIEAQLSLYRPDSEVAHLNARAARDWVRVSPEVFRLLDQAAYLSSKTEGAFDITVAPLIRCWGFMGGTGQQPAPEAIEQARQTVGMRLVELDPENFAVRFRRPGIMLDFGAIGKGHAIDKASGLLREEGITSAVLHGGTSTVFAIGKPPDQSSWKIAIEAPPETENAQPKPLAVVELRDEALSVSAVWGKSFSSAGKTFGHIIDPRTGYPADNAHLAAVVLPSATETDALSTALLTSGPSAQDTIALLRPDLRSLVMKLLDGSPPQIQTRGIEIL